MTLRLIEIVPPELPSEEVRQLFAEQPGLDVGLIGLGEGEVLLRILLEGNAVVAFWEERQAGNAIRALQSPFSGEPYAATRMPLCTPAYRPREALRLRYFRGSDAARGQGSAGPGR